MASLAPVSIWTDPRTFFTLVSIAIVPYTVLAVAFILYTRSKPIRARSSVVLVLGDFGRSPRMMYHAQSLVEHGWETFVVAYGDTAPIASLTAPGFTAAARTGEGEGEGKGDGEGQHGETDQVNDANNADNDQPKRGHCHLHYLSPLTRILSLPLPWAARAAIRLIHQCIAVLYILWIEIPCYTEFIIVQTPPAIPTLMLVQIAAMVSGSKVVVDWHNTGWSVLAQRLGRWRGVMWLAKSIERITGQNAYAHLFVSRAQKAELAADFDLYGKMEVLHDRPPKHFRRTDPQEKADLFERLSHEFDLPEGYNVSSSKVVISSTSWTPDEDFTPLITALDMYEQSASQSTSHTSPTRPPASRSPLSPLPPLLVLITGKGPLRASFARRISSRSYRRITVRCLFVLAADYPVLLGTADLGLSFHASTSGTDLPMKIVDMLGCGVPVLAKGYGTLGELVQDGREGRWFGDGRELGELLIEHMTDTSKIDALRANIDNLKRWEDNWHEVVYQRVLVPTDSPAK